MLAWSRRDAQQMSGIRKKIQVDIAVTRRHICSVRSLNVAERGRTVRFCEMDNLWSWELLFILLFCLWRLLSLAIFHLGDDKGGLVNSEYSEMSSVIECRGHFMMGSDSKLSALSPVSGMFLVQRHRDESLCFKLQKLMSIH